MKRFRELLLAAGLTAGLGTEGCATTDQNGPVPEASAYDKSDDSLSRNPESGQKDIEAKLEEQRKLIESYTSIVQRLDAKIDEIDSHQLDFSQNGPKRDVRNVEDLQIVLGLFRKAISLHSFIKCVNFEKGQDGVVTAEYLMQKAKDGKVKISEVQEIYTDFAQAETALKQIFEQKFLSFLELAQKILKEFDQPPFIIEGYVDSSQAVDSLGRQAEYISSLQELIVLYQKFGNRQVEFMFFVPDYVIGPSEDLSDLDEIPVIQ